MLHITKLWTGVALASLLMLARLGADGAQILDTHPDGYPTVEGVKYFGALIKERTAGRYAVEVYHSAQLGEEKDTIEQVRSGVIELNRVSMAPFNGTVKENHRSGSALYLPFRSTCTRSWTADRRPDQAAFEPAGLVALAFYDAGARSFYNAKKPIKTVEDMKGLKFRVIQSDIFVDMVAALGANRRRRCLTARSIPRSRPASIDGAENNFPTSIPPSTMKSPRTSRSTSTRSSPRSS